MFVPIGDDIDKRTFPIVGTLLISANALVYIFTTRLWFDSLPTGHAWLECIQEWGLVPEDLARGRVFTLMTYMFLHGDITHVLGNMIVLWAFVGTLEGALGGSRFLGLYLLWGVLAGTAHALMHWDSDMPMIGASGAIAGMMGAYFVAFGPLTQIRTVVWFIGFHRVNMPAGLFAGLWVCMQLLGLSTEIEMGVRGVAWYAHLGGCLAGAGTMLIMGNQFKGRLVRQKNGVLQLRGGAGSPAAVELDGQIPMDEPAGPPAACPHCETPLEAEHQIHDSLMRCPNPDCQRLIYFS